MLETKERRKKRMHLVTLLEAQYLDAYVGMEFEDVRPYILDDLCMIIDDVGQMMPLVQQGVEPFFFNLMGEVWCVMLCPNYGGASVVSSPEMIGIESALHSFDELVEAWYDQQNTRSHL